MIKYVIYENESKYTPEHGMTSLDQWNEKPFLQKSVDGGLMRLVKEFEAETWEEAMQVYNDHYGFGKYKPMEE